MSETRHPRRLDDDELATWLPIIRFVQLLPQVLDRALKDEVGLNHARYAILVTLAGQGEDAVTMTELARIAGLSRSRLSHALDSLEERGWVERTSCSTDKRTLSATLTPAGREMLRTAAPVHVAQIRELILDPLSAEDRQRLQDILGALLPGVTAAL
ncbi:MarR family transcriptional regulator [Microbacterium sp. p3-SID338]|uniref:MarR family winged helix-turn-helix transcriptional regulator n=1 Tax=unclassified Microbacterium TaxID=2609290 RepID=UPI000787718A|nr:MULTISPECIES: MarR family transcriptional regulator [unclassified Microbacterium]KYJ97086.1 MarR family transcriptional regulator [Microbacterium sp. CH1]MCT1394880.1 MarR family transcriptional regulator [Microbacterium sp. p3-SID338]PMC02137.1 MarR family transcriptional regulator [Microbacterium sp. UMB0228]